MLDNFKKNGWTFNGTGPDSPPWPENEAGEREERAYLCNVSDASVAGDMTIRMLSAFGIPVVVRYAHGTEPAKAMWAFSAAGKDLYVPKSMLEQAKELLSTPMELDESFEDFGEENDD